MKWIDVQAIQAPGNVVEYHCGDAGEAMVITDVNPAGKTKVELKQNSRLEMVGEAAFEGHDLEDFVLPEDEEYV